MYFILILGISYALYLQGIKFLFKSKLFASKNASLIAYIMLMLSGVVVIEYIFIKGIPYLFNLTNWQLIFTTTITSIIAGEIIYYRNYKIVNRVISKLK